MRREQGTALAGGDLEPAGVTALVLAEGETSERMGQEPSAPATGRRRHAIWKVQGDPAGPGGELSDPCHCEGGTSAGLMMGPFWT